MTLSISLFAVSLIAVLWASELLGRGLDRLGSKMNLSDNLLGVLTALGSDSPEITSAVVAIIYGERDLGVGIVFGSNLFNLAGLLGLGALIAGTVRAPAEATILNGAVAAAVTLVAGCLIAGSLGPAVSGILLLLLVVPYLFLVVRGGAGLERLPVPEASKRFLRRAVAGTQMENKEVKEQSEMQENLNRENRAVDRQSWKPVWLIPIALAVIVGGSIGLVKYATAVGRGWLPPAVLGTFVLAVLTGLPNSITAVRLARVGKGSAVITEAFNSNTINVVVGLVLPALIFGEGANSRLAIFDAVWLMSMTILAAVLSANSGQLSRKQGIVLIVCYFAFAATWWVFRRY